MNNNRDALLVFLKIKNYKYEIKNNKAIILKTTIILISRKIIVENFNLKV